uniref:Kinesin family member 16Ba n=1 Tax=Nothobranchius korthausae TaxID=1143690 RepID=A0A1A8GZG7_9TELE
MTKADGDVCCSRLEFERQQREELEKLEMKRRLIKDMEAKHLSEKAELERLQQEVESQRKESEEVQQRILRQEESLRHRSQDIESRLQDFLAEKERFEEERRSEIQGAELQRRRHWKEHREKEEEQQNKVKRWQQQAAEQPEIYRELERLEREREEQKVRMETERRRLEEQEREQLSLVGRLEEQLREKHEAASALLAREDARRLEEERQALAEIREVLLRAKEAAERSDVEDAGEEGRCAHSRYMDFKEAQVKELGQLEEGLRQQRERLEKEVASERSTLLLLAHSLEEVQEKGVQNSTTTCQEELQLQQTEHRLQFKEQQLANLTEDLLPTLAEEKQKAVEVLERSRSNGTCDGPSGLDNTLFQVEKELEEKEEKLHLHWHSAQQLQQLQETYEFTTNVARQEDKVRRKEKEILESREKQQREAMEQAVARLERRQSALRRSSSLELDTEEQRPSRTSRTEADLDQQRVEREIQRLRQRIVEGDDRSGSPIVQTQSPNTPLPLSDDRINAYIEEEVQRRLREMNLLNGSSNMNLSRESVREEEKLQNLNPRRLKYEHLVFRPAGSSYDGVQESVKISIPRYVLRGQGKDEHFEFEVKISVADEMWTVFRRYSRFREMHKSLKSKYPELAALEFPPKKLFGNRDERMVAERRSHLERYLQNLFRIMLSSSRSPLRADEDGVFRLSKLDVCEFSAFFKKGVFESSSHGTS